MRAEQGWRKNPSQDRLGQCQLGLIRADLQPGGVRSVERDWEGGKERERSFERKVLLTIKQ
jgi:hypothetical protein